jgi:N-acetylglucosaminyl-diphospho-decaprenol L-rhamnosyltransferase
VFLKLLISIVSHNQQGLAESLLQSIDGFASSKLHEVVIVLTENTVTGNNAHSKRFELLKINNLRQKGFGANHNAVFERFESDFFIIVNPDIILNKTFDLDLLVDYLNERKIDIASPVITNSSGALEDYKRSDLSFWNLCKRKIFRQSEESFDWLAGMFLVVRSESFRKLGGFDTDFFMYVEDCDLCMRACELGMTISDLKDFSVIHLARRASTKSLKHLKWHVVSLLKYWFLKRP